LIIDTEITDTNTENIRQSEHVEIKTNPKLAETAFFLLICSPEVQFA